MTERIRWEPAEPGSDDSFGYTGTLDRAVFTLWSPRDDGVSWAVTAAIPGTGQEDAECRWGASREEAAAEAERWLEEFVSSLGAVFPEEDGADLFAADAWLDHHPDCVCPDCRAARDPAPRAAGQQEATDA